VHANSAGLTGDQLMALGKVALMGADLERTVEMVLKTRLQLNEKQAHKLIYKQNFAYKVELITSLHQKDDPEYQDASSQAN
jgi:hypothetical protein